MNSPASATHPIPAPAGGTNDALLADLVVAALRRLARAIDLNSRDLLQRCGLTTPQLLTMRALIQTEPVTIGALAEAVAVSQATMSGIIDRLEQHDFLTRQRGRADRRSMVITSTPAGKRFVETAPAILHDRFRQELNKLDVAEQAVLLEALERIARMMGAEGLPAAPILTSGPENLVGPDAENSVPS